MPKRRLHLLWMGTFTIVLMVLVAPGAGGGSSGIAITACGQTVTTNAFLAHDLSCTGSGVIVGADKITVDLRGFVLSGDRDFADVGVDDEGGFDNVKIENGLVRNFGFGVLTDGSDGFGVSSVIASGNLVVGIGLIGDSDSVAGSTSSGNGGGIQITGTSPNVSSSTASGNENGGILVVGDEASVKSSTSFGNGSAGIAAAGDSVSITSSTANGNAFSGIQLGDGSDFAMIKSSNASGNGDNGIVIPEGSSASISSSTASGNATEGIRVDGDAARLKGNHTDANGFQGGNASDHFGLGIRVAGFTIPPTGTNVAHANDDPAECLPASLC